MDALRILTTDEVRGTVAAFDALTWPAPAQVMTSIARDLGWTIERMSDRSIMVSTRFATSSPRATAGVKDGDLGQVSIDSSDRVAEADRSAESEKALGAAARSLRDEIMGSLGAPVRSKGGANARYTWDLAHGGRIAVAKLSGVVQIIVLPKRYADVERAEERLRISGRRDPSDPANDLA